MTDQETTAPFYIDERKVSEITGLTVSCLRAHRFRRVGIPFFKIGRAVRYRLDEVESYMNSRKVKTEVV